MDMAKAGRIGNGVSGQTESGVGVRGQTESIAVIRLGRWYWVLICGRAEEREFLEAGRRDLNDQNGRLFFRPS